MSSQRLQVLDAAGGDEVRDDGRTRVPLWALVVAIAAAVVVALVALGSFGGSTLPEINGPPVE